VANHGMLPGGADDTPRYNADEAEAGGRGDGLTCREARRPYRAQHRTDEGGAARRSSFAAAV